MDRHHRWPRTVVAPALLALLVGLGATAPGPATAPAAGAEPDWNRLDDPLAGGIGLHAGQIGGMGLAFKWPLRWYLQVQVAGGIWNTEDDHRHNVGLELQYLLRQDPRLRLFLLTGLGYFAHDERGRHENGEEFWRQDSSWNTGFGVGVEYLLGQRWAVKIDADFTYQSDDETVTLWPQAGLMFYW
jgi:hypothetical protein